MTLRARPSWFFLLLLALVLGVVVERLVVTDSEAIETRVRDAVKALANREFDELKEMLTEDFDYEGRNRDASVVYLERLAKQYEPRRFDVSVHEVVPAGDRGSCRVVIDVSVYLRVWRIIAAVRLAREEDGWRIAGADLVDGLR